MTVTVLPGADGVRDEHARIAFEYIESHGVFDTTPPPGYEWAFGETDVNVSVSATAAPGTTIVTTPPFTPDGGLVICEFFCPLVQPAASAGASITFYLYEGATQIVQFGTVSAPAAGFNDIPTTLKYRFAPTAAAHTYAITATESGGAATAAASGRAPMFIRFTKV